MNNNEIRTRMKRSNIYLWEVADNLSMHESTLCKWFRHPLTQDQKTLILSAIESISLSRISKKDADKVRFD